MPGQHALACPGPNWLQSHETRWVPAKWVTGADGALGQFYIGVRVPLIEARSATFELICANVRLPCGGGQGATARWHKLVV